MKHIWLSYIATLVLFSSLAWIGYPILFPDSTTITSPLPSYLNRMENNQVSTLDFWLPKLSFADNSVIEKPVVNAKSALIFDMEKEKTFYSINPEEKLPMASLTKIMTAIIALENKRADDTYLVKSEHLVGENSMGVTAGETYSFEELLYGLILSSGNDAAEVLADNSLGREAFILAMNNKAKALGLTNTNFTNPSGLSGEGNQYTTAYDLLVMTRFAMDNFEEFRKVVATIETEIPYTLTHKYIYLSNQTNLLRTYPGVKGVKTGYTEEAQLCLVTYLEYEGHRLIGIVLGSQSRREDMINLLDFSLKTLSVEPPKHS